MSEINREIDDKVLGFDLTAAGTVLVFTGYVGIDSSEAGSPEQALASISLDVIQPEPLCYVTTADLGFAALAGVGAASAGAGIRKLFGRRSQQ